MFNQPYHQDTSGVGLNEITTLQGNNVTYLGGR